MRGHLGGLPVILASATPSLETAANVGFALAPDNGLGKRGNWLWAWSLGIPAGSAKTEAAVQAAVFARLRKLKEELNMRGLELDTLSMGMSADFETAITEGATQVRIGTALFGPRLAARRAAP